MSVIAGTMHNAHAQAPTIQHVEAAFLYNFAKFIEWPVGTYSAPSDLIKIGILGVDPFGEILDNTIKGKTINGRKLTAIRFEKNQPMNNVHILFISSSEEDRVANIFHNLRNSSTLTVSDMEGFTQIGGIIKFFLKDNLH